MSPEDREKIAAAQALIYGIHTGDVDAQVALVRALAELDKVHSREWTNPDRSPRWRGYPRVAPRKVELLS